MINKFVNNIANRLSLRPPQRRSLEIINRICEILSINEQFDIETSLTRINTEFPSVTNFEREFPSLCFALATGVGKTRLMGAFISYLNLAHGIKNFFVLAPNLTIYNKLINDFTPNTPKYVFTGISEFAIQSPVIITGDNYETNARTILDPLIPCKINIFNISKINSEVRGGRSPKIKRLSEYIGESYFDYLSQLKDLVILMDESHRYRATAGLRAINELKPLMGLELTATPSVETSRKPLYFKNVIYEYSLGKAIIDGFVKDPAVVTRKDFNPASFSPEAIERIKLEDGIYLHENIKAELKIYALQTGKPIVKPFMLVIARDTYHATQLLELIKSDKFAKGYYTDKVIQVD
ncbi:DEAD/DEAH box helicase family protein [Nostoc sp. LPT]|uniref:DEAD/DEAH box helicase family protein n=1 Tax=Nostoc sp. LPT TaxID=2815387 RepID=UPI0025F98C16|nr:DEAD/DEAH box helicase family protein [Nostoc sp. LPT]